MNRIDALIHKLKNLREQNADPAQLLTTVKELQQELMQHVQSSRSLGTTKVAVLMPAIAVPVKGYEEMAATPVTTSPTPQTPAEEPVVYTAPPTEEKVIYTLEADENMPAEQEEEPEVIAPPTPQPPPPVTEFIPANTYDQVMDIPTLSQHLQEKPASTEPVSLNDMLKKHDEELGNKLTDTPIKDLRKGVGINDRFAFINELFRGDEAMYERSIKTINAFNIYPEAEYWISRELKLKLGWQTDSPLVAHFDQLVKRRFS